jgi:HK97 family phage major capsid protein
MEASAKVKQLLDELAAVLAEMGALQEQGGIEDTEAGDEHAEKSGMEKEELDAESPEEDYEEEEAKEKKIRCLCERAEKIRDRIKFYESVASKELELRTVLDKATPASEAAMTHTISAKEGRSVTQIYHNLPGAGRLRGFKGPNAEERAYRAGMFYKSQLLGDAEATRWCVDHGVINSRAMGEGVNSLGGVFVNEEVLNEIIVLTEQYGVFVQNARNVNMQSDTLVVPRRVGGLQAYFIGENTSIPDSDASWDRVQLVAKKCAVSNRISSELLQDSVLNLADYLTTEIARSLAILTDRVGFVGTGSGDDGGIVGAATKLADGSHNAGLVTAASGHTGVATLDIDDFVSTVARLPVYARARASWYCSPAVFAASVQRLGLSNNGKLTGGNTADSLANAPEMRLLGYPVQFVHTMNANLGVDAGAVKFLLGDLSLSTMYATRRGLQIKTSVDRYAELDQTLIVASTRFDACTHDAGSNTVAGPLVGLRTALS